MMACPMRGRIEMTYATVSFPQDIVAGFGFNDVGRFFERSYNGLRVQIDVLKIDHSQPYHQPKWNQKAENCLCRNEGGSYAALHFPLVGKVHHLLSHQDIDSQGPSRPPMNGAICLKRMIPSPIMMAINEYFQYCSFVLIKFLYFLVKKHKRS